MIGVLFSKLNPGKDDVFVDIGCGSGKVSKFFSNYVKKTYAVDCDKNAYLSAKENLGDIGNVEVVLANGYDFLRDFKAEIVFFGGTKEIERMLDVCKAEKIAVNAARMEVAIKAARKMKELGIFKEVLLVSVSKGYELAGGTAFKPLNPVFIVVGGV